MWTKRRAFFVVLVLLLAGLALIPARTWAQTAEADRVYRAGNGVSAPRLTERINPEYTAEARQKNIQGTVVMHVVIGIDGKAHALEVTRELGYGLDEKAIECVRQWRFEPGQKDGKPVAVRATIEMNFRLPESARL